MGWGTIRPSRRLLPLLLTAALVVAALPAAVGSASTAERRTPAWQADALARLAQLRSEGVTGPEDLRTSRDPRVRAAAARSPLLGSAGDLARWRPRSCYRRAYRDPAGDNSVFDTIGYALSYACEYGAWFLDISTADAVSRDLMGAVIVELDTDRRRSTGCDGFDWVIIGEEIDGFGMGLVFPVDSHCEMGFWFGVAYMERVNSHRVTLVFDEGGIGGPRDFNWRAATSAMDEDDLEDFDAERADRADPGLVPEITFDDLPDSGTRRAYGFRLDTTGGSSGFTYLRRGPSVSLPGSFDVALGGDWNGDGRDDLLLYGFGDNPDAVFLARSTGGFRRGPAITLDGDLEPTVGDFNGDGRDDLLVTDLFFGGARFLVADGTGRFKKGPHVYVPYWFPFTTPGDYNGDGRTDLFLWSPEGGREQLLLNRSGGYGFKAGPRVVVPSSWLWLTPGDFNGDGRDDLLAAAMSPRDRDQLFYAKQGSIGFRRGPTPTVPFSPIRQSGDFDGDGDDDAIDYGVGPERDVLLRTTGSGALALKRVRFNGVHTGVVTGDFNGDGRDDVLLWGNGYLPDQVWYGRS